FFQAEDGIRDFHVTGVQTCALPISEPSTRRFIIPYSSRLHSACLIAMSTGSGPGLPMIRRCMSSRALTSRSTVTDKIPRNEQDGSTGKFVHRVCGAAGVPGRGSISLRDGDESCRGVAEGGGVGAVRILSGRSLP